MLEGNRLASILRHWGEVGRTPLAPESRHEVTCKSVNRMTSAAKALRSVETEQSVLEGNRLASALRHWAQLGRTSLALKPRREVSWEGVNRMTSAAKALSHAQIGRLRGLLLESNSLLAPLTDPLLSDFDLHRWLVEEREEIYSDWLEWLLRQLPTIGDVFDVLGIRKPEDIASNTLVTFSTNREAWVKLPHWESFRRLDLVVRCSRRVLVLIEVKKTSADWAEVEKQRDYAEWSKLQPESNKYLVLLAKGGERPEYYGFQLRTYRNLCLALREKVRRLIEKQRMPIATGALVLAYVGTVEQNLLGLSSAAARRVIKGEEVPTARELTDYLEQFLERRLGQ